MLTLVPVRDVVRVRHEQGHRVTFYEKPGKQFTVKTNAMALDQSALLEIKRKRRP